jgi:Flp pilus assembly protein TadD
MDRGLTQAALRVCEEGILRNPGSADLSACQGRIHQSQGRWPEAEAAFRRALKLQPARQDAQQALGRIAFERGDYVAASRAFRTATELECRISV